MLTTTSRARTGDEVVRSHRGAIETRKWFAVRRGAIWIALLLDLEPCRGSWSWSTAALERGP